MRIPWTVWSFLSLAGLSLAAPYRDDLVQYNINTNQNAQSPLEYTTSRSNTTYTPSPDNWRAIPFYTILLDKFADGDPSNNDYFGTMFEYDWRETQLRAGGDLKGLVAKLDYLTVWALGASSSPVLLSSICSGKRTVSVFHLICLIFLCIKPLLGYSPLDFSVLDPHWGTLDDWRKTIDIIHAKNMYIMVDFTVGTMGDLVGFDGCVRISFTLRHLFTFIPDS
jgi:alpha-1,3-glucan synthase